MTRYLDEDNFTQIQQLIGYWKYELSCMAPPEKVVPWDVASFMADIVMTPVWIEYCHCRGKHYDKAVRQLYDLVWSLSVPHDNLEPWNQVRELLNKLEAKYGCTNEIPWKFEYEDNEPM